MRRRRTLMLPLAAALLGVLPAPAPAALRASDFEVSVRSSTSGAHAARAGWTSAVIKPGRRFDVFGLKWRRTSADVHPHVRVRVDGRWRRWVEASTADAGRPGTAPVWAGGAEAVQIRLDRRVRGLRVHFVRVRGKRRSRPAARAAQAQPAIIPRSSWGGDTECRPRDTPSLGSVQMAFVHHTVNANEYAPEDAAAMVLGICRFHRNSNGWDDIGYNFLVDKYGQVFEGRAGGIDQPVIGAQAQGWNAQSTGIANLGTYQDVPQAGQAVDAMARLLAWKLTLHGVPVTGTVTLRSAGGDSNRYPAGTYHTFERISGHRDGNATACPGEQLYAQLPAIRARADGQAPGVLAGALPFTGPRLALAAAHLDLAYPEPAQLTGTLLDPNGRPQPDTTVRIQVLTARGFKAVTSTSTGADGTFAAALPTSRNRAVRALVGSLTSNVVKVRVVPALSVRAPARRVHFTRRSVLAGTLRPKRGSIVVEAALQRSARSYRRVLRFKARVRNGRFRAAVPLRRPGLYRLRVRFAGDRLNAGARTDFYVRSVRRASAVTSEPAPSTGGSGGLQAR